MIFSRSVAILSVVILSAALAFGQQRPLITDDVDIIPPGSINIGAGVDFLQNAKFSVSGLKGDLTRLGDIRVRAGFAPNVEFQLEGSLQNYLAIRSAGPSAIPLTVNGNSTHDVDDYILSAKLKLKNESRILPAIGFKLGFQMPNTNQARGIGTNETNIFGKFLFQKHFGRKPGQSARANIYGNLGLEIMTVPLSLFSQNDVTLYGLAGIFRLNRHVNIASEINGRVNTRRGYAPLGTESVGQFRIGPQVKASGLTFDTAAVFGLTKFSPRTGITFGVTYQSPSIFKPAQ